MRRKSFFDLPEMGTHKQQTIISVKRSETHCCIWLKRWQDTNLIIRNEYDKSCAQPGTRTTCSLITLSTARNVSPQPPINHSIKTLIHCILLLSRLLSGKHDVSFSDSLFVSQHISNQHSENVPSFELQPSSAPLPGTFLCHPVHSHFRNSTDKTSSCHWTKLCHPGDGSYQSRVEGL